MKPSQLIDYPVGDVDPDKYHSYRLLRILPMLTWNS